MAALADLTIFCIRFLMLRNQTRLLIGVGLLVCLAARSEAQTQTDRPLAELTSRLEDALAEKNGDLKARQSLIVELDRVLDQAPSTTVDLKEVRYKVRFLEALNNFRLNDWDLCESQCGHLKSIIDPHSYPEMSFACRSLQAAAMLMKGQSEEGLRALEELLASDTSKVPADRVDRARTNHAFALEENGRFDEAVAEYQRVMFEAIEKHNDLPALQAGNNMLSILLDNEDVSAARQVIAELEPLMNRNPQNIGTLAVQLQRQVLQCKDGDLDAATQGVEELSKNQNLPPILRGRTHELRAIISERMGAWDDAIKHAQVAIDLLSKSPSDKMDCQILLARLLLQKGDYEGALNEIPNEKEGRVTPAIKKQIYQLKLESNLRKNGQDTEANWLSVLLKASEDREHRFLNIIAKDFEQQLALVKRAAADQHRESELQAAVQTDRLRQYRQYLISAFLATCGLGAGGLAVVHLRRRAERRKLGEQVALNARLESLVESRTLELKANLAAQAELSQALERKKRIETVGLLAGNVAHDINNLLQVIANANQTLADQASSDESRNLALRISNESLQHGAGIVGQVLAYSRQQTLAAKSVCVGELLSSSRPLFHSAIGETISLHIEDETQGARVFVDPSQLTTALLNLLSNSADAMPTGGTIAIRAALTWPEPLKLCGLENGEYVLLTVTDTGIGFQPEELARAFEPFFSTKRVGDGTGLGLSSVKGFVNRSGGEIRIESSPGAGACVRIWLPRHTACDVNQLSSPPKVSDTFGGKRLLLVEDNSGVAQSIMLLLKQVPLQVVWAASGDEAAKLLRQDCRYDFVLSDIRMPGTLDGVELARWIACNYPQLPVILMSGYSDVSTQELNVPFLQKPFKLDDLKVILRQLSKTS